MASKKEVLDEKTIQKQAALYRTSVEGYEYALEFFSTQLKTILLNQKDGHIIDDYVIPLHFLSKDGIQGKMVGCFTQIGEYQHAIYVELKGTKTLTESVKKRIRHELIHYGLWLAGIPHTDETPQFWSLATVFHADPYMTPSDEDLKYLHAFLDVYRERLKKLEWQTGKYLAIRTGLDEMQKSSSADVYKDAFNRQIDMLISGGLLHV